MKRYRRMMVCLSCTEEDPSLLGHARVPARWDAMEEIRFVHVLPSWSDVDEEGVKEVEAEIRAEVAKHFGDPPPGMQVRYDVMSGSLLDCVLRYANEKEVDLILVGHRLTQPRQAAFGRRLAMKAPSSVWMVPEGTSPDIRRILVPYDFSRHAADAVSVASSLAKLLGGIECLALYVYLNESPEQFEEYEQLIEGHEEDVLNDSLGAINTHGIDIRPLFEEGIDTAEVIRQTAEQRDVDLIVMATRGRSQSAAVLLGSVTEQVIINSRLPLFVVKHQGAQLGLLAALLGTDDDAA